VPLSAVWLAGVLGVVLLVVSAMSAVRSARLVIWGSRAVATIVDIQSGGEPKSVYPVFRFTDANGVERTAVSRVSVAAREADHGIGTRVPILFDPAHPDYAQQNSFRKLWVVPLVTGAMGLGWLAAAAIVWKMRRVARLTS
jgi:hypothetical protein